MEKPLISVIVPIYNGALYVERLYEDIQHQTCQNLEILLIDDGSQDGTWQACTRCAQADARFKAYHKENGGVSSARNFGLQKASGDYLSFVDVDDHILPQYFEYLSLLLAKYDADMACCGYYKMRDSEKMPEFAQDGAEKVFTGQQAIKDLLYRRHVTGYSVLKLLRREVVFPTGGKPLSFPEDIAHSEDFLFVLECLKRCKTVAYGERTLYIYYQYGSSANHTASAKSYIRTWEKTYSATMDYAQKVDPSAYKAVCARCFVSAADCCCRFWDAPEPEARAFVQQLMQTVRQMDSVVLFDKDCKPFNRVMALLSCLHAPAMIRLCRAYLRLKEKLHFETRHAV